MPKPPATSGDGEATVFHLALATPPKSKVECLESGVEDCGDCEPQKTGFGLTVMDSPGSTAAPGEAGSDEDASEEPMVAPTISLPLPATRSASFSLGSAAHASGECQPCPWFWKPGGCQNGEECKRCHLCPEGELKARKKAKHAMFRLGLATPKTRPSDLQGSDPPEGERRVRFFDNEEGMSADAEAVTPDVVEAREEEEERDAPRATISLTVETKSAERPQPAKPVKVSLPMLPQPIEPPPGLSGVQLSIGSLLHGTGQCQPCAWRWKPSGCSAGSECSHCHLCPEGELKARKKQKRTLLAAGLVSRKVSSFSQSEPTSPAYVPLSPAPTACAESDRDSTTAGEESGGERPGSAGDPAPRGPESGRPAAPPGLETRLPTMPPGFDAPQEEVGEEEVALPGAKSADGSVMPVPPGLMPPPETPSHGSTLHNTGSCQPCAWFWKPNSCSNGVNCGYCHLCPESELKARKKAKQTQMRLGLATPKVPIKAWAANTPTNASKSEVALPPGFDGLSKDAPAFHMPDEGSGLSAEAPEFQPLGFWPLERSSMGESLDALGLATPQAWRDVEAASFCLNFADVV